MKENTPDVIFNYLKDIIYDPQNAQLNLEELPNEFQDVGQGLLFLGQCLKENYLFGTAIANGDMNSSSPPIDNVIAGSLKRIQANLRHLTWVTKQVTQGDYSQRIDYMGDFSESFNTMIQQLNTQRELLEHQAYIDDLTGLYNRKFAINLLKDSFAKEKFFSIAFIDIDMLKYCNDNFGHEEGNQYICDFCSLLLSSIKKNDYLCRMGGDEFLLLSFRLNCHDMENLIETLRFSFQHDKDPSIRYPRNFSYGCVDTELNYSDYNILLKKADEKMYAYKSAHSQKRI